MPPDSLFVTISQSGETADTLAALRLARQSGYLSQLAICNVPESSLVRESELVMLTRAGPEIGVASTKAFTTQLAALGMLVVALARHCGSDAERERGLVTRLIELPSLIEKTLQLDPVIQRLAERFADKHHALFLGRGALYPIAMEGALKLKEISYIHAEAYPAGELKHGPLALVDADMPVIAVAPNNDLLEKLKSNLMEVRARGGELIVFADSGVRHRAERRRHGHRDAAARDLLPGAGGLHHPAAAARLPRRDPARHGRRSAAQPRQERHGRIAAHDELSSLGEERVNASSDAPAIVVGTGHKFEPVSERIAPYQTEPGYAPREGQVLLATCAELAQHQVMRGYAPTRYFRHGHRNRA